MAKQHSCMIRNVLYLLTVICIYSAIMSGGIQPSIGMFAVAGLNMNRRAHRPNPNINKKTNGVISIDLKEQGFAQTELVFKTVAKKLKSGFKDDNDDQITKDYTKKHFAKKWRTDYPWLALRAYTKDNNNRQIFNPAWICVDCNKHYSAYSTQRISEGQLRRCALCLSLHRFGHPRHIRHQQWTSV